VTAVADGGSVTITANHTDLAGNNATQALCTPIIYECDAHTPRWGPSNRVWMRVFLQNRVKVLYGARMTIARITCR
jgi:hypothetical protein